MKKVFIAFLSLALCLAFAGCSSALPAAASSVPTATPAVAPTPSPSLFSQDPSELPSFTLPETSGSEPSPSVEESSPETYDEGMYEVGTDIPAGEYFLTCTGGYGAYFEIDSDTSGTLDSIVANGNFETTSIVTVKKGQYLTVESAYFEPLKDLGDQDLTGDEWSEGMYKAGLTIPEGKYKLLPDEGETAYVEVDSDSNHVLDSIVTNDNFDAQRYITIKKGQYITVSRATLVKQGAGNDETAQVSSSASVEPSAPSDEPVTYDPGMYEVGAEIPAGEYILIFDGDYSAYFEIDSDTSGALGSIIANDNFDSTSIVTVKKGQYFTVKDAYFMLLKDLGDQDLTGDEWGEGMYKVGLTLPAGKYKLIADEGETAYVEIDSNSSHVLDSIVTNDNFENSKTVTVKKGQYLKVSRATIQRIG